jgi:hypothetical protein
MWEWFWALSDRRSRGYDSPEPVSYGEMHAWQQLTRTIIRPEEVEVLTMMDAAWLRAISEYREETKDDKK